VTLKTILVALALLPRFGEDREAVGKLVQEEAIGRAVAKASGGDQDLAAFLLAWGDAETHFSLRIQRGDCYRWECDKGLARGPWQAHRNAMSASRWALMVGVQNTEAQAEQAARIASWALHECRAKDEDSRILGAFRLLGGLRCDQPLKGEESRLHTFRLVRSKL
jgi:hypothetical protein